MQHQDGHSHIVAPTIPNCIAYDPAYAYETAVIVFDGLKRLYQDGDTAIYYITVENEKAPRKAGLTMKTPQQIETERVKCPHPR